MSVAYAIQYLIESIFLFSIFGFVFGALFSLVKIKI